MGLIQKLKSALGLDGAESPDSGTAAPRDVDVTVEREPSSESEDAVKGTETASSGDVERDEPGVGAGAGESTTEETPIEEAEPDAGESSAGSTGDEAVHTESEAADEGSTDAAAGDVMDEAPAEDADDDASAVAEDDASGEGAEEAATESVEDAATEDDGTEAAADVPDDPVTEINGIGPAYGQRLSDAGVDTVADLAGADPDELEAATDISAARIEGWIDAAAEY